MHLGFGRIGVGLQKSRRVIAAPIRFGAPSVRVLHSVRFGCLAPAAVSSTTSESFRVAVRVSVVVPEVPRCWRCHHLGSVRLPDPIPLSDPIPLFSLLRSDPILLHSSDPILCPTPTLSKRPSFSPSLLQWQVPIQFEFPWSVHKSDPTPFSDPNRFGTCTLLQLSSELSTPFDDVFDQFNYSNQS